MTTNYCENSERGIETLPICCLITENKDVLWCTKVMIIFSHVGFRNGVKFCSDPYRECEYRSTAELHLQKKDKVKNIKKGKI